MKYFLVYNDWAELVETLPMEERGRVLTALFRHANGEEELGITDPAAKMLVMMMTKQMDRDTEAYDRKCERNRKNIEKRYNERIQSNTNVSEKKEEATNVYDGIRPNTNVYDGMQYKDKDKDKDKDKYKDKELKKDVLTNVEKKAEDIAAAEAATSARKEKFYASLVPFVDKYGKDMIRDFFDYWSEMNRSKTKMRFEQQATWELALRLKTWADREKIPKKDGNPKVGVILTDNSIEKFKNQKLW